MLLTFGVPDLSPAYASTPETLTLTIGEPQTLLVDAVAPTTPARDGYSVESAPAPIQSTAVQWPLPESSVTSRFGKRPGCPQGCSTNHRGLDFAIAAGTPIAAVAGGTVTDVSHSSGGYGTRVIIAHPFEGISTLYAHMLAGSPTVRTGQTVIAGQTIGLVGSTGVSTAPHLHLEVRAGGIAVDPLPWLQIRTR